MSERVTSVWVPIDKVVPHTENPNRMSDAMREKLRKNIEANGGKYEPITVRSLEKTVAFQAESAAGKYQILNGYHRWLYCKEAGHDKIEVRVWPGITDEDAKRLLLTMNRIHGEDDKKKRSQLLRDLAELEPDAEVLAGVLPEDASTISKMLEEASRVAVEDARERARAITQREPVTVWMEGEQSETVRRAIDKWLKINDPENEISDCREGAALAGIARYYLDD